MNVLLDTNVVSELMRKAPDPTVAVWAAGHRLESLFFSAVGEAELRYGAAILPTVGAGRRWSRTSSAARAYADIAARRRSTGRSVAPADCQIAAIARSRRMAVATRNVRDFEDVNFEVVDPEKVGGAWEFRGTRVPVSSLFENLRDRGMIDRFLEWFPGVEREQLRAVLDHENEALRESARS